MTINLKCLRDMIVRGIVDYSTNRFIFIEWINIYCKKCNYHLAKMLDKNNIDSKIKYCFNCKKNYKGDICKVT